MPPLSWATERRSAVTCCHASSRSSGKREAWIRMRPRRAVGQRRTSIVLCPVTTSAAHGCLSDRAKTRGLVSGTGKSSCRRVGDTVTLYSYTEEFRECQNNPAWIKCADLQMDILQATLLMDERAPRPWCQGDRPFAF